MRRIYESQAIRRDDDDPFSPSEAADAGRSTSFLSGDGKTVHWDSLSHAFMPVRLRDHAVTVDVSTRKDEYAVGETVCFTVEMYNRYPCPITLKTDSPVLWTWAVDGLTDASEVEETPPDRKSVIEFDRGERKRFVRRWQQRIRISEREWEETGPGEYTISAGINVDGAENRGLVDETTVRIVD